MAIYGTSSGGKKYTIGSQKGQDFVNNAKPGSTITGADGSTWTKNRDGSTTIVQNGSTYTVPGTSGNISTTFKGGSSIGSASSGASPSRPTSNRPSGGSSGSSSGSSSGGSSGGSSGSGYTGGFRDYSKPSGNWAPGAPKYTGGIPELDAYLALKSQEYFAAKANNDARGMADAHNAANQARNWFGYSAEDAREDINKVIMGGSPTGVIGAGQLGGLFPNFNYQNAPEYVGQWDSIIKDMADQILNRDPFEYNYLEDPNYIALKGMYTREGDRAMQDAIGSVAARTGGMASSYAASAASQANNYFMSQLSDKIPELQQIAYEAYMAGVDGKREDLSMLMGLDSRDYNRYLDSLSQWNADRNFGYGVWRDQVNDQRYEDETAYNREQDEWEKNNYISEQEYARALEKAQNLAASGNYDGYKALGYTDAEIATMKNAYDLAQAAAMRSYSSGSGGSKSSSGGGNNTGKVGSLAADALGWASQTGGDPEDFIRAYYKDYGYSSQSQALAALAVYEVEHPAEITGPNQLGATARTLYDNMVRRYTSANRTSFASDIKNALNAGRITEAEADFILAAIGF